MNYLKQTCHIYFVNSIEVHVPQILVKMVLRVFQFLMDMPVNASQVIKVVIVKQVLYTQ